MRNNSTALICLRLSIELWLSDFAYLLFSFAPLQRWLCWALLISYLLEASMLFTCLRLSSLGFYSDNLFAFLVLTATAVFISLMSMIVLLLMLLRDVLILRRDPWLMLTVTIVLRLLVSAIVLGSMRTSIRPVGRISGKHRREGAFRWSYFDFRSSLKTFESKCSSCLYTAAHAWLDVGWIVLVHQLSMFSTPSTVTHWKCSQRYLH